MVYAVIILVVFQIGIINLFKCFITEAELALSLIHIYNILIPLALTPNGKVLVIKCDLDIGFDKKIFLEEIENKQEYLLIDNYLLDAIESQERACLSFRWNKVENYLEMDPEAAEHAIHYFSNLEQK